VYDEEGNLLDEKPIDANEVESWKKISTVRNKVEDLTQQAKGSKGGMDFFSFKCYEHRSFSWSHFTYHSAN
jgi:hypothetical protein